MLWWWWEFGRWTASINRIYCGLEIDIVILQVCSVDSKDFVRRRDVRNYSDLGLGTNMTTFDLWRIVLFFSVFLSRSNTKGTKTQRVRRLRVASYTHETGGSWSWPQQTVYRIWTGGLDYQRSNEPRQPGRPVRRVDSVGVKKWRTQHKLCG